MARLITTGYEIEAGFGGLSGPDGEGTGILTRDTTTFRSGAASAKYDSGSGNQSGAGGWGSGPVAFVYTDGRTYYLRVYVNCSSAPTTTTRIIIMGVAGDPSVRLRTDGGVELFVSSAAQGSPSASICDGTWRRLELSATATATGNWTAAELRVDGASIATWSGTQARGANSAAVGWVSAPGVNKVVNFDDVALNDSAGATNNTWPGAGNVVLLKPTADSAVGTGWTLGTGTAITGNSGKTAVSNTPPLGVADLTAGSDPKQIRNAASAANSNYDATMTTYTAAGVGASDTVNAVQCWVATSAASATSPKAGTVGIVSNPAVTNVALAAAGVAGAFYSGQVGAAYSTQIGWKWSGGTMTEAPSVTKSTAPVMRITQVTASTRIADVCAMFIYVDYTPAVVKPRRPVYSRQVAVMRPSLR